MNTNATVSAFNETVSTSTVSIQATTERDVFDFNSVPVISIQAKTNFGQKFIKTIKGLFSKVQNKITIINPQGNTLIEQEIVDGQNEIIIKPDQTTPGTYIVKLDEKEISKFSWGVLAINTDKDVYKPNETAKIDIGVLDSYGLMVCDAEIEIEFIDPEGNTTKKQTSEGTIKINKDVCESTNLTLVPDYQTEYEFTKLGEHKIKLSAKTNGSIWQIEESIKVESNPKFQVVRKSATRLYPINHYPMSIEIIANEDFDGQIVENYPDNFSIVNTSDNLNDFVNGDSQKIERSTEVSFTKGNSYYYHYFFDPPNVSPDFFLVKPLVFLDSNSHEYYKEQRSWQMANDSTAVSEYFMNSASNWTAPSGVTSVSVEAWGGGGGGAGATATTVYAQAGGGGGAYSKLNTYSVTAGNNYAYSAGAGGTRGTGAGGTGGDSNFINGSTLLAKGGTGGSSDTAGTGGASGSGVGDTTYTGGDGAAGTASATAGGSGGGSAGSNGNGTAGSTSTGGSAGTGGGRGANSSVTTEQNGLGGQAPGGGGSGAYVPDGTDHSGGIGAPGQVKITYTTPSNAPTFVGSSAQTVTTGTTRTPVLPGGVQSGDLILLFVVHRANVNPTYTITGYTQRASQYYDVGTGDLDIEMWYKIAGGSEGNPSITASTGTNGWSAQLAVYRGVDTTNPFDVVSPVTNTSTAVETLTPTGVTTTSTYAMAISAVATYDDNNVTLSTSPGFTNRMDHTSYTTTTGSDHSFALADAVKPSTGAVTFPTWRQALDTGTGALTYDQWVYISDAINPINNGVTTPSLDLPTDTNTNQSLYTVLKTTTTDLDSDYLRYKIELCTNVDMTTGCQTFDQTSSQTGWSGQDTQTSTAYTSGTQATYTIQSALTAGTTYYWRSYAIDPAGTNTWSGTQTPYSFTTTTIPTAPTTPYTEGSTNPSDIIDTTPEFSAIHGDPNSDSANYYEIEVNTASDFTGTVMWDSGQVSMSNLADGVRSADVSYAGTSLSLNGTQYFWRIRFTDTNSAIGSWSTTQNFTMNSTPNTPSLDLPTDTATNQSISTVFGVTSTDTNSDYLRYKIELCENVGMSTNCQTFDQTSSQTGWSGQDTETSTAYTSGTQATYTIQTPLTNSFTYYWRSYSIDPGGSNTWSATQGTPYSFTTESAVIEQDFDFKGLNFSGINIE